MKKLFLILMLLLLTYVPGHASSVTTCTLTFTNITTISTGATSCTGQCAANTNCAIDTTSAESVFVDWIPNATTHTATDWDIEVWTSEAKDGQYKYYTDAETAAGALATIGGAADTRYDVTNPSGYTIRYTFDGTGTDPTITATDPAVGSAIAISGFATANNGVFIITAAGTNYFEIYNKDGVAEVNITAVTIVSGTNAAGSMGITTGSNFEIYKISENAAVRADATVTVTVNKK